MKNHKYGKDVDLKDEKSYQKKKKSLNLDKIFEISTQKTGIENKDVGYLYNVQVSSELIKDDSVGVIESDENALLNGDVIESYLEHSCLHLYFVNKQGLTYKSPFFFRPYFYLGLVNGVDTDWILTNLEHKYKEYNIEFSLIKKVDLSLDNHLLGEKKELIKVSFVNVKLLVKVKGDIINYIKNKERNTPKNELYFVEFEKFSDVLDAIDDIYEFDILYETRVLIDNNISVGMWYETIRWTNELLELNCLKDDTTSPDLRCLAWDIETTKEPLKFPNVEKDQIMMISCVFEGQGYLITNREIVSNDIIDFEYSPKKEFVSYFKCINCDNEESLIECYVKLIQKLKPHIIASYNGDNFDFPFLYDRAKKYGINVTQEWGIKMNFDLSAGVGVGNLKTIFSGTNIIHFDCYRWVERDSYLPCGSRSLKSVTKAKLRYNPVELDPELMVPYAINKPELLAEYSVSDAVATYYLYKTYVHTFIFALATIIPLSPEDLLRRGTGTLCENLLMKEAFTNNILFPNKKIQDSVEFYQNRPILNSTYVGATVESLCSGIFRADIAEKFNLNQNTLKTLIDNIDSTLLFGLKELGGDVDSIENYENIKNDILNKLNNFYLNPIQNVMPLIYHLDVAAMYPNIILTNRLQPTAIINETKCMRCPFYSESHKCQRKMNWRWKGDVFPISRGEMDRMIKHLRLETFENVKTEQDKAGKKLYNNSNNDEEYDNSDDNSYNEFYGENILAGNQDNGNDNANKFNERNISNIKKRIKWTSLTAKQQSEILIQRMKTYSSKLYRKQTDNVEETRSSIVCQRENSFYIDTVRRFRDRRYIYKTKKKEAEEKIRKAEEENNLIAKKDAQNEELLYESLQLAHKCILNSFYGYVMRKGSRWFSMEMAAIVTWLGGNVIKEARILMEGIGKPLELDTDGIWAILPSGFPEEYNLIFKDGKKKRLNYICTILNQQVHKNWTNYQYMEYDSIEQKYNVKIENSIYFEVDGPYKCFFMPASDKQNKLLKKRYAVFDFENKLRELKGFELKRRGELQLIKILQEELFPAFLRGKTRKEAYDSVASISRKWLNLIETKGKGILDDEQLFFLISESKNMSKSVEQMGEAKSMSITTARRLFEFLQNPSYILDKNIVCKFIVSEYPKGVDKSQRAIPLSIFSTPLETRISWLSKWTRINKNSDKKDKFNSNFVSVVSNNDSKKLNEDYFSTWNVRNILDWDYYKKRLENTILKIVIIPAISQGLKNPLPELEVPYWLKNHVELTGSNQQKISQFFTVVKKDLNDDIKNLTDKHSCVLNGKENKTKIDLNNDNNNSNNHIDVEINNNSNENNNDSNTSINNSNDNNNNLKKELISLKKLNKIERINLLKEKGFKSWLNYTQNIWFEKYLLHNKKRNELSDKLNLIDKDKLTYFGDGDKYSGLEFISEYSFLTDGIFHILDIYPININNGSGSDNKTIGLYNIVLYSEKTGQCHVVMFEFFRRFYIATNVSVQIMDNNDDNGNIGELSYKSLVNGKELPRGVDYNHLTEVTMSERRFQNSKSTLLCDHNTVGIYETNIPLEFTILEKFGNMIESITPNADKFILNNGVVSEKYWKCYSDKYKQIEYGNSINWLMLTIINFEDRICLLLIDINKFDLYLNFSSGPNIPVNLIDAELKNKIDKYILTSNINNIYTNYYKSNSDSFRNIDLIIENLIKDNVNNSSLVLLVYSNIKIEKLKSMNIDINTIKENVRNDNDNNDMYFSKKKILKKNIITIWSDIDEYTFNSKFTKFNWHNEVILESILILKENINKLKLTLELSKVIRLPVLYLIQYKHDLSYLIYDILYSRELHSMGLLSWGCNGNLPDLGNPRLIKLSKNDWDIKKLGISLNNKQIYYNENNNDIFNSNNNINDNNVNNISVVGNDDIIEIVRPGVYRSYCAELEFRQWLIVESVRNCMVISDKYKLDDFNKTSKNHVLLKKEFKKKVNENNNNNKERSVIYNLGKNKLSNINNKNDVILTQSFHNHSSLSTSSAFLCLKNTINYLREIVEKTNVCTIFDKYNSNLDEESNDNINKGIEDDCGNNNSAVITVSNNILVEFIITLQDSFYSWLCSPKSLLYDPALIDVTKEYTSRYFKLLDSDLRELGIKVIYGNIRKMLVTLNIDELKNSGIKGTNELREHYIKMTNILNSKQLYSGISLTPNAEYKAVIQIDRSNYLRRTFDIEEPYDINLNILNYYPVNSRKFIIDEILNFLMLPLRKLRSYNKKNSDNNVINNNRLLYDIVNDLFGPFSENFENFLQAITNSNYILNKYGIDQYFDPLRDTNYDNYGSNLKSNSTAENINPNISDNNEINIVPFAIYPSNSSYNKNKYLKLNGSNNRISNKNIGLFDFPECIGNKSMNSNFINNISGGFNIQRNHLSIELSRLFLYIWSLDKSFYIDDIKKKNYEQIKYMICQTINISEFDQLITKKWSTPFYSYIIKDFKCPHCFEIDDFDFIGNLVVDNDNSNEYDYFGDNNNSASEKSKSYGCKQVCWYCNHCNNEINYRYIEERLLSEFFERLEVIQSQDILCCNCKSVQIGYLQTKCQNCTGGYLITRLSYYHNFKEFFYLFNSVAEFYSKYNTGKINRQFEALIQIKNTYENVFIIN
ncbi:DNA polymerase epsilon catalytic subunit [Cryptosporidium xiaoi]|uniref:DNA-directed DNA polymerase n=1 Tax=Cryptosporidium xiaoi TaxID=659607 RepID=A0AAV9Y2S0_9CRYT